MAKIHPAAVDKAVAERNVSHFRELLEDARYRRKYYDGECQRYVKLINKAKAKYFKAIAEIEKAKK